MRKQEFDEYVSCLIYAGWISEEAVDEDYQAYLKRCHEHSIIDMSYQQWLETKEHWQSLNNEFVVLEKKHGTGAIWDAVPIESNRICDELQELDYLLAQ
jgi:hypothetical protein